MIDFHCHLDLFSDPRAIVEEADTRGVYILAVTTTPKAWQGTKRLIGSSKRIRVGLGLHPELVAERHSEVALFEYYLAETRYVGEIGLDGSTPMKSSFKLQEATLARILRACSGAGGRVLSLHSRRAASGVLDALEAEPKSGTPILHWFSGSVRELDRAVQRGCWFSVGPVMLQSSKGRELVARMPRHQVLTETDAPFAQRNGKPLMPWEVSLAYPALSEIWGCEVEAVPVQIASNLRMLTSASQFDSMEP